VLDAGAAVELLSDDQAWLVQAAVDHVDRAQVATCAMMLGDEPRSVRDPVFVVARARAVVLVARPDEPTLAGVAAVQTLTIPLARTHAVPAALLCTASRVVGLLLCVRDRTVSNFNLHDIALLTRIADAGSIDIARALSSRTAAHSEARVLAERGARMTTVTSALNDAARVHDVVAVLTDHGAQAAFATGALFARVEPEGQILRVLSSRGLDRSFSNVGDTIPLDSQHPLARAACNGEPVWLPSVEAVARYFLHVPGMVAATTGALAILPMRIDDRLLGVLVLRMPTATFDAQERGLLRILVRHAAHALDRAELYESERRAVHRLEQVAAVSAALAVSSDLTSTLTTITEAFVPAVAEGVRVELSAEFDHRTHATGVATDERKRTLELTAHGESLGQLRLFGVRASTDDADDTLFVEELARRASLAVHAARTFRDLRAAIDAREEFLSVAGHELRTPLTTLKMCLFGMRDTSPSEARVAERQIARLETVVDQLLDITKMSAGRLNLEPEQVDLAALVREVAGQLDHAQQSSGSEIAIRVQGSPAGMWDRFRIAQVITNLLTNALKYGGGRPVDVEIDDDADVVRLSVRDRGIGIAHDALQRIFDRFERAVTSREYAGFGVGLWICRQIVEAHGGVIRVESKPAEGSEFLVVLPKRLQSEVA
jgi:signal transduction histidine kinase